MGHFLCRFLRLCYSLLGKDLKYLHIWNIRSNFAPSKIWGQQNKNVLKIKIMKKIFTLLVSTLFVTGLFAATEQAWYNDVTSIAANGQYYIYSVNGAGFMQAGQSQVQAITPSNYTNVSTFKFTITTANKGFVKSGDYYLKSYKVLTGNSHSGPVCSNNSDDGTTIIWTSMGGGEYWNIHSFYNAWTKDRYAALYYKDGKYDGYLEHYVGVSYSSTHDLQTDIEYRWYLVSQDQLDRHFAIYFFDAYKETLDIAQYENNVPTAYYNALQAAYNQTFSVQNTAHSATVVNAAKTELESLYTGAPAIQEAYLTAKGTIDALEAVEDKGEDFAEVTADIASARTALEAAMTVEAIEASVAGLKAIDPITFNVTEFMAGEALGTPASTEAGREILYDAANKNIINAEGQPIYKGTTTLTATAEATDAYYKFVRSAEVTVDAEDTEAQETKTITYGDNVLWHNIDLSTYMVGTHYVPFDTLNVYGGAHVITLALTVNKLETLNVPVELVFCEGGSEEFRGETYDAAGTHEVPAEGATRDTMYIVNVVVNQPSAFVDEPREIIYGAQGTWNGYDLSTYAIGPHTLTYTTTNAVDCDSVVTMQLTVLAPETRGELEVFTCPGVPYEFMEQEFEPDFYTIRMPGANCYGGDSILELTVSEYPTYNIHETIEMNDNETREWQGESLSGYDEGTYNDIRKEYTTVNGCDSIYSLTLIVHPTYLIEENKTIMEGQGDTWHGKDLNEYLASQTPYTVYDSLETVFGGDSVYVLTLTVTERGVTRGEYNAAFCDGDEITFEDVTYSTPFEGDITVSEKNIYGGDSIVHLKVTVYPKYETTVELEMYIGGHMMWNGYDLADWEFDEGPWELPEMRLRSVHGCDSIIHTYLNVLPLPTSIYEYEAVICDNETYSDENFSELNEGNDYQVILRNYMGGDSIITLHLTVNQTYAISEEDEIDLTHSEYIWHEQVFPLTGEGTFELVDSLTTVTGCDSVHTLTLRVYKLDQELTWLQESATVDVGDKIELVAPTTTSGLEAVLSFSDEDLYTIEENGTNRYIVFKQAGELTITASQPGNTAYNAAEPVSVTYTINPVTGLEEVEAAKFGGSCKVLYNGQLFILHNGKIYDVSGRKMK